MLAAPIGSVKLLRRDAPPTSSLAAGRTASWETSIRDFIDGRRTAREVVGGRRPDGVTDHAYREVSTRRFLSDREGGTVMVVVPGEGEGCLFTSPRRDLELYCFVDAFRLVFLCWVEMSFSTGIPCVDVINVFRHPRYGVNPDPWRPARSAPVRMTGPILHGIASGEGYFCSNVSDRL